MLSLSIVLIVYKIEKYLPQCIESVLSQTYRDYELILVDDGSPDKCPEICDKYALSDSRIKVIHQENQGSVLARWNGILAASGEYVSSIDGDDFIEPDMCEHMMSLAKKENADIVAVGIKEDRMGVCTDRRNHIDSGVYSADALDGLYRRVLYDGVFYEPGIMPSLCNKLIRREMLLDSFEHPDKTIKMGEDAAVSYPMIAKAKTIVIDNSFTPYHYRIVNSSMSRAFDELYFDRIEKLIIGLHHNLSINERMQRTLPYYALFILNIGVEQLLARQVKTRLNKRIAIIKKTVANLSEYMDWSIIDWAGFTQDEEIRFKALLAGKVVSFTMVLYLKKIVIRIKRLFRIH